MIYSDDEIVPVKMTFGDLTVPVYTMNTIVIGAGAAGLAAINLLYDKKVEDIALVTEGMRIGTSRVAGEESQSFNKSVYSVRAAAESVCSKGAADGDIIYLNSSMAERTFYKLVEYGVRFRENEYGEYLACPNPDGTGEYVDLGNYTAGEIAEALDLKLKKRGITIFNRFRALSVIKEVSPEGVESAVGIFAIDRDMQNSFYEKMQEYNKKARVAEAQRTIFDRILRKNTKNISPYERARDSYIRNDKEASEVLDEEPLGNIYGFTLIRAENIIFAAGALNGIFEDGKTLYAEDAFSSLGMAFNAGVYGKNITETVFGIASAKKFKWKLKGDLQSVIPRYYSMGKDGRENEFLVRYIKDADEYERILTEKAEIWEFSYESALNRGNILEIAVAAEYIKGKRVYVDYRRNSDIFGFSGEKSDESADNDGIPQDLLEALGETESGNNFSKSTPFSRLMEKNPELVKFLKENGLDIESAPIEVDVCAAHLNGGLVHDLNYESNIKNFYPIGEAAATFGVYCPMGWSLAQTQISAYRAASAIAAKQSAGVPAYEKFNNLAYEDVHKYTTVARRLLKNAVKHAASENIFLMREKYKSRFSGAAMIVRPLDEILYAIADCTIDMAGFMNDNRIDDVTYLTDVFINHDMLITQYVFLNSIKNQILNGGKSCGNYIICGSERDILTAFDENGMFDMGKINSNGISYRQKKGGMSKREHGNDMNAVDYKRLNSFIRIKSPANYEMEYFTKETESIPNFK